MPVIPRERKGSKKDFPEGRNDNDSGLGVFAVISVKITYKNQRDFSDISTFNMVNQIT
jgi:hypothetical protein